LALENETKSLQYEEIPSKNIQMMRFGHIGLIEQSRAMLDSSVVSEITVPEHPDMRYICEAGYVYIYATLVCLTSRISPIVLSQ
jgi:hypothetical protein